MKLSYLVAVFSLFNFSHCAKILGVFPMSAHSHFTLGFSLMKLLAEKGHDVTFINPYPQKNPIKNLRDVSVSESEKDVNDIKQLLYDMGTWSVLEQTKFVSDMGLNITETIFQLPNFQKLLAKKEKYDVIILESFISEGFLGLGIHFDCPVVLLSPQQTTVFNNYFVGNPTPSMYIPNIASTFTSKMNLVQRMKNIVYDVACDIFQNLYSLPKQEAIMKKYLPHVPSLEEAVKKVSLLLVNSHISTSTPAPSVPASIEIGGYHVDDPKPLPNDLQVFLDGAKNGAVLFTLGSNLKMADLSEENKKNILNSLKKLKQKVLWKFETDLPNKPHNVKILSFIPQNDVLAHPNVKVFVTHGGMLSTIEAVYHGVPIVGLPVFWDQELNIKNAEDGGYGIFVPFRNLTEENLSLALNEVINNPKYTENVKLRSQIMHGDPINQKDAAVFWIEYVIRYKGAPHLKSPVLQLKWYQAYMLDIFDVLVLATLVIFYILKQLFGSEGKMANKKIKKN